MTENEAKGAWNVTIIKTREKMQKALEHLTVPGLFPNISCASLNATELQNHNVSSYRCIIQKLSKRIPELSDLLDTCRQYLLDAEQNLNGQTLHVTCSLPTFEQDHYRYMHAKCMLQLMNERLSRSKDGRISF